VQGVEGSNPFTRPKTNEINGLQRKLQPIFL
jgi:hypothetical protein